ncbi:MAG: DUF1016 family protein [Chitinivibrionales bacterium]|nr:DUF1016 family protein [Chitinivibrionales bacterium]
MGTKKSVKRPNRKRRATKVSYPGSGGPSGRFSEVLSIIREGRNRAYSSANSALVECYWRIGHYISSKVKSAQWGSGVVSELADYLQHTVAGPRGFSERNLWRMMQFYDLYASCEKLSPLVTQVPWTNHLIIISKAKSAEEREFYLKLCASERYSKRELERQIDASLFERTVSSPAKTSRALLQRHPGAESVLRDSYALDFLGLPSGHSEEDLRKAIVGNLKSFIIEFGRDFAFVGEEYRLQVGMKDFRLDLLFYHRELQCLVAIELKIDDFKPEHLGQMSFYLEALDRDVKKTHENPSIGIVLCKGKDDDVVEYALSRTLSPAAVSDYTTRLPDKHLLESKLHEFFDLSVREMRAPYDGGTP